jgi:hypothetical protein
MTGNYWIPVVDCKTPNCLHGKPTFLPYPNHIEITQDRPSWPTDDWKAFVVCRLCGQGYEYKKQDIQWGQSPILGLWEENFFFYVELKCAQDNCESRIRVFRSTDQSEPKEYAEKRAIAGSGHARCLKGHSRLLPAKILGSSKKVAVVE